jgi:hypothetical protein
MRFLLRKSLCVLCVALWLMAVLIATARPAYAYVDPGAGLLFMQMVGTTFAGITLLLRKRVRQFFGRFRRNSKKEEEDTEVGNR